ncbi:hypothetical protein LBMAG27_23560 [Bacteroidota bacterium]|nr:hypothetical protein LBMAG27_23560 [Bacteroidota bacterium]
MAKKIIWTPQAEKSFDRIIIYLRENWTQKEIEKFLLLTNKIIENISEHPDMFRRSSRINIHEAIITKHNLLLYCVKKNQIDLLAFWDTRQHPKKKSRLIK